MEWPSVKDDEAIVEEKKTALFAKYFGLWEHLAKKYHLNYYQIDNTLHLLTRKELPTGRFKLVMRSKAGKAYQYLRWFIDRKSSLIEEDSKSISETKQ